MRPRWFPEKEARPRERQKSSPRWPFKVALIALAHRPKHPAYLLGEKVRVYVYNKRFISEVAYQLNLLMWCFRLNISNDSLHNDNVFIRFTYLDHMHALYISHNININIRNTTVDSLYRNSLNKAVVVDNSARGRGEGGELENWKSEDGFINFVGVQHFSSEAELPTQPQRVQKVGMWTSSLQRPISCCLDRVGW